MVAAARQVERTARNRQAADALKPYLKPSVMVSGKNILLDMTPAEILDVLDRSHNRAKDALTAAITSLTSEPETVAA